jgi:putative NADPH-quinone reductase
MAKRIVLIQGHPDASVKHFGHALADAYTLGAAEAGHELRTVEVARLEFPLLRSQAEWQGGPLPRALKPAQEAIAWAEHLALFFPIWLGDMPALLKGFLEQVARPGFAFRSDGANPFSQKGLSGRSARIVVTIGMPALLYRCYFRAHSVKNLERNILGFVGFAPIRETLIGQVDSLGEAGRDKWLGRLHLLGRAAG